MHVLAILVVLVVLIILVGLVLVDGGVTVVGSPRGLVLQRRRRHRARRHHPRRPVQLEPAVVDAKDHDCAHDHRRAAHPPNHLRRPHFRRHQTHGVGHQSPHTSWRVNQAVFLPLGFFLAPCLGMRCAACRAGRVLRRLECQAELLRAVP